jgi:tetratricopeptide (TPR) repeat protein
MQSLSKPRRVAHLVAALALLATTAPAAAQSASKAQTKGAPAAAAAASASASATAAPMDEATALFKKGIAADDAGKQAEAEELFRKAWALKQTWDIAANLGLVESRLGKHAAAAEHLAYAARLIPPTEPASTGAEIAKRLESERAEVAAIKVRANVDGAEVWLGGERKGATPLAEELFAAAGSVTIELRKDGYETVRQTIEAKKGAAQEAAFTMRAKETPPPEPNRLPAYLAFGAGGVGLVLGAITGGISLAQYGDVKKTCSGTVCPESQRSAADAGKALGYVSTVGFVLAGVGAAAGVTLLLVPIGKSAPGHAELTLGPAFVGVKGAF